MGTIVRRGERFRAVVRIGKHPPQTQTFDRMQDARKWMGEVEVELRKRKLSNPRLKVQHLMEAYERDILPNRRAKMADGHWKRDIPCVKKRFGQMTIVEFAGDGVTTWALKMGAELSPSSKFNYIGRLWGFFRQCEMHFKTVIPWEDMERCVRLLMDNGEMEYSRRRERRISPSEVERIKQHLPPSHAMPLDRIIDFCIATCMRIGEVTRIRWSDYDAEAGTIIIRDRKHPRKKIGNHKLVPLLGDAVRLLDEQRAYKPLRRRKKDVDFIFPNGAQYASVVFHESALKAGVLNCVLHDTRHEGISRLFEQGYHIEEVALVSGHADWKHLARYTHLSPRKLVLKDRMRQAA